MGHQWVKQPSSPSARFSIDVCGRCGVPRIAAGSLCLTTAERRQRLQLDSQRRAVEAERRELDAERDAADRERQQVERMIEEVRDGGATLHRQP